MPRSPHQLDDLERAAISNRKEMKTRTQSFVSNLSLPLQMDEVYSSCHRGDMEQQYSARKKGDGAKSIAMQAQRQTKKRRLFRNGTLARPAGKSRSEHRQAYAGHRASNATKKCDGTGRDETHTTFGITMLASTCQPEYVRSPSSLGCFMPTWVVK